jgi:hypothetical protein
MMNRKELGMCASLKVLSKDPYGMAERTVKVVSECVC